MDDSFFHLTTRLTLMPRLERQDRQDGSHAQEHSQH
jgi:hypothetical protein